jgi:energy-coupling factor transporter ATP-binding protein EcfA2
MLTAFVILTGASGAGKTTIAQTIEGIRIRKLLFIKGTALAFLLKKSLQATVQWTNLVDPYREVSRSIGLE